MPLNGLVLKSGVTSMTVVGGTDKTFSIDGMPITNGVHVSDGSVADFRLRPHLSFKYRPPKKLSDGSWTRERWAWTITTPELIDGTIQNTVRRGELEVPPGSTKKDEVNFMDAQISGKVASGALGYIATGSLA